MFIPISISLYPNGNYNYPILQNGISITSNISSYAHSITSNGGCESATIKMEMPIDIASQYLNYILYHVRVFDEYSQQIWIGYINSIQLDYGSSITTIGVNNYASRFVLFVNGNVSGTLFSDNSAKLYGDKIEFIRVDAGVLNATQVTQNMTRALLLKGSPNIENKTTSETKSRQTCSVTINCAGYYSLADWKTVGATALAGTGNDTTLSISSFINNNIFNVPSISPSTYILTRNTTGGSGIIDATTNRWDAYTPYSQVISDLIDCGTINGNILSYGVYPDGLFDLSISRINTQNIDYYKSVASSKIYDVNGAEIPPTQVLPDKNLSITELRPAYTTFAQQIIGLQYINRVSLQISRNGYSLTLEPATLNDASYELARLVKKAKWRRNNR
jgi:hypothetical protein